MRIQKIKIVLLTIFMLLLLQNANAQDIQSNKKVQISYSFTGGELAPGTNIIKEMEISSGSVVMINANLLDLSPKLIGGFYLGFGAAGYQSVYDGVICSTLGIHYGIDLHYSVLPFNGDKFKRWDILLNASLGSYFNMYQTMQIEYGIGITLEFYPFENWGLFAESSWGKYQYGNHENSFLGVGNTNLKIGISYRL